jgi:quercetin dioxygenase-like cupin family protein
MKASKPAKKTPQPQHMSWTEIKEEKMNESITRRLVVGQKEMLGYVKLKKGAIVPAHKHLSEQITYILSGSLKFTIYGKDYTVNAGEVLIIPSNVIHAAVALEDTDDLDCFSPLRRDWLTGTDKYLRTGKSYLRKKK